MSWWSKLFPGKISEDMSVLTDPEAVSRGLVQVAASYTPVYTISYDGEKNAGDIGPVKKYYLDYAVLRERGWQMFLDSEVCQLIIRRFARWVIGRGLDLQAEPSKIVLGMEGISIDDNFVEQTEARFSLFAESKKADISEKDNLHKIAKTAFTNAITAGDVLVILRVKNGWISVQLIDGANVGTPMAGCSFNGVDYVYTDTGNRIIHGVEVDVNGKHIAYHIKTGLLKYERIEARDKYGRVMAYLPTGLGYRINGARGIPLITAVMETSAKLDRYKEAFVGSAEESAKTVYSVEHQAYSTGENPLADQIRRSVGINKPASGDNPVDENNNQILDKVAATTGKQAINLPIGASLKFNESKKELYFKDFYTVNIQVLCAVVGIPPEVAMMKYDSNFSASRAALKDWEHSLNDEREDFANQFYKPIYHLFLDIQVLTNKIQAPGYMQALVKSDIMVLEAYRKARFGGVNVPHIDPLKEVEAERAKLGKGSEHIPLTTVEKATESLNGGDYWENMRNYANELKEAEAEGIEKPVVYTRSRVVNDPEQ